MHKSTLINLNFFSLHATCCCEKSTVTKIEIGTKKFLSWFFLLLLIKKNGYGYCVVCAFLCLWRHMQYVFSYYALKRQNSRQLARPVEPIKVQNHQVDLLGSIESADSAKLSNQALLSCVFNSKAPVGGVIKAKCLEGDKLKNCKLALKGLSNVMKNYSC